MKMNRRQLPLHALRAFEVTARLLSMRRAAEELGVTHGAISHQIRSLEASLEVRLFNRLHNRLALTAEGQRYYTELHRIFEDMLFATNALNTDSLSGPLTIGCSIDTAANWLVPALDDFIVSYPEIEVRIVEITPAQEIPSQVEVGISNGMPKTKVHNVVPLVRPRFYPVCSPSLIIGAATQISAADICQLRRLHTDNGALWHEWQIQAGTLSEIGPTGLYLPSAFTALTAARKGLVVALAQHIEVQDDLNSGQLIRLSEISISSSDQYYQISRQSPEVSNRALLFAEWVQQLVQQSDARPGR